MIKIDKYINKLENKKNHKDIPVFSCIFINNEIVASSFNDYYKNKKVSGHAEINAINKALKKLKITNLSDYKIFTSLEPCIMCYGAIKQVKINEIVYLSENLKMSFRDEININKIKVKISKYKNKNLEEKYLNIISSFFLKKR
ncbi:nucleoside deaminase [Mesoplasma chauliocola]|uniref:Nucleoside deaminase n=1 Tax=Mesoplasma chauliocola TaxID=216427 RepID=A0A249SPD0_9MOLU|nr:nucleoside deaminase [Mesoplasma chauliocola]ASZ09453.1 nucleoside deaminase [Mesoplasma chauliocola]